MPFVQIVPVVQTVSFVQIVTVVQIVQVGQHTTFEFISVADTLDTVVDSFLFTLL